MLQQGRELANGCPPFQSATSDRNWLLLSLGGGRFDGCGWSLASPPSVGFPRASTPHIRPLQPDVWVWGLQADPGFNYEGRPEAMVGCQLLSPMSGRP